MSIHLDVGEHPVSSGSVRRLVAVAVLAAATAACTSTASERAATTTTSPYTYPKAYAWSRAHLQDVNAVITESETLWQEMQSCDLQPDQFTCPPSTPPSPDPGNWTGRLPQECGTMTTDVSTARSDGPVPNAQAQGWWDQSLTDFDQACSAITEASAAYQQDFGTTGYDPSVAVPAQQAVSDLEAAVELNNRVGTYVTAKRH